MNVSCASCHAVFRVDPTRVPPAGVTARCTQCGAAVALGTSSHLAPGSVGARTLDDDWFAEERGGAMGRAPFARAEASDDWFAEEQGTAGRRRSSRALLESDAAAAPEIETLDTWFDEMPLPAGAPAAPIAPAVPITPAAPPRHPFRQVDPQERARRLARALVSDLIAYHPGRREAAHAAGTLRIAFREEIARSYAVYTAEVGREMAERTSHFHEALNEMLAQGRALF